MATDSSWSAYSKAVFYIPLVVSLLHNYCTSYSHNDFIYILSLKYCALLNEHTKPVLPSYDVSIYSWGTPNEKFCQVNN